MNIQRQLRHRSKRYKVYIAEAPPHYESIMDKYGMPPIAHPPLSEDLIEKVMFEQRSDWDPKKAWSIKNG